MTSTFRLKTNLNKWTDAESVSWAKVNVFGHSEYDVEDESMACERIDDAFKFANEARLVLGAIIGDLGPGKSPMKSALRRLAEEAQRLSDTTVVWSAK